MRPVPTVISGDDILWELPEGFVATPRDTDAPEESGRFAAGAPSGSERASESRGASDAVWRSGPTRVDADGNLIEEEPPARTPVSTPAGAGDGTIASLQIRNALQEEGLQIVDVRHLAVSPTEGAGGVSCGRGDASLLSRHPAVTVDVSDDEGMVVLLERADGAFEWVLPEEQKIAPTSRSTRAGATRRLVFRLNGDPGGLLADGLNTEAPNDLVRRGTVTDFLCDKLKEGITAWVFQFAADKTAEWLIKGQDKRDGWMHIGADGNGSARSLESWHEVEDLNVVTERAFRGRNPLKPLRILLFIHGTFSSTLGSFGALCATEAGRTFLDDVQEEYDLLLGYDHKTLGVDPVRNAEQILEGLKAALPKTGGRALPQIDIVCYSRGGLVFRSLVEHVVPTDGWKADWGSAVFVAAANGGTHLAEPENWKDLVDTYTNLSSAALKLVSLYPQAAPFASAVGTLIKGLGGFVKMLVNRGVTEEKVPGLAAMEPDGDFIRWINSVQPGQPTPSTTRYFAITSAYDRNAGDFDNTVASGPLRYVVERVTQRLFRTDCDLVVDTALMTLIEPEDRLDSVTEEILRVSPYIRKTFDYGYTRRVDHLTYFLRPETVSALRDFLELPDPATLESSVSRSAASQPIASGQRVLPNVPYQAETNVLLLSAALDVAEARRRIHWDKEPPAFAILFRTEEEKEFYYALRLLEFRDAIRGEPDSATLGDVLSLASVPACLATESSTAAEARLRAPSASAEDSWRAKQEARSVLFESAWPVAVVSPPDLPDLTAILDADALRRTDTSGTTRGGGLESAPVPTRGAFSLSAGDRFNRPLGATSKTLGGKPVTRYFQGEMPAEVRLGRPTPISLTISPTKISSAGGTAADSKSARVQAGSPLTVRLLSVRGFLLYNEDEDTEVDELVKIVEDIESVVVLNFLARGTVEGEGEIRVYIEQEEESLLTLTLKSLVRAAGPTNLARRSVAEAAVAPATPRNPEDSRMLVELEVLEKNNGSDHRLQYIVRSTRNGKTKTQRFESPEGVEGREAFIQEIYSTIEGNKDNSKQGRSTLIKRLQAVGTELFRQLFPPDLQRLLWENRENIGSIYILSFEPYVPWEIVHLASANEDDMLDENAPEFLAYKGLTRWVEGPPTCDQVRVRPDRVGFCAPQYPGASRLPNLASAQKEADFLMQEFAAQTLPKKQADLLDAMHTPGRWDVLHFACHGSADTQRILNSTILLGGRIEQDANGYLYYAEGVTPNDLKGWIRLSKSEDAGPLVVINACQTARMGKMLTATGGITKSFLVAGAGIFVGALWEVLDDTAFEFAKAFYNNLKDGQTLAEAATNTRRTAGGNGDLVTPLAYCVYGQPGATVHFEK